MCTYPDLVQRPQDGQEDHRNQEESKVKGRADTHEVEESIASRSKDQYVGLVPNRCQKTGRGADDRGQGKCLGISAQAQCHINGNRYHDGVPDVSVCCHGDVTNTEDGTD